MRVHILAAAGLALVAVGGSVAAQVRSPDHAEQRDPEHTPGPRTGSPDVAPPPGGRGGQANPGDEHMGGMPGMRGSDARGARGGADASPPHMGMRHGPHCRTVWRHHRRVRMCR